MMDDLQPYPEYKESGLPWLGRVPKQWATERLKWLTSNIAEQAPVEDPTQTYIALEHVESWTGRVRHAQASNVDSVVKRFLPEDVLFGKLRPYLAKVTRAQGSGVCVGEFFVIRRRDPRFLPRYFEHLLRSQPFIGLVNGSTFGAKMPRADWGFVGSVQVPVPSLPEQQAIADYLDAHAAVVRRFIRNRRRLIEVLNEQKQAIINRAVTRGPDPNVRLKPSGIDWLGDVPEQWTWTKLKRVARVQTGLTLGKRYVSEQLEQRPYLRVANVQTGRLDLRVVKTILVPQAEIRGCELRDGDVLMTEGGDIDKLGRGCVWHGEVQGCLHQNHIFAVRPDQSRLLPEYLVALMASQHGRIYFELTAKKTTNLASTNSTTIRAFPFPLPSVLEQQQILMAIADQCRELDDLLRRAHQEIDLVREYRTRLIADVVTGKLDVRGFVPPEEIGPADLEDVVADLDENGEEGLGEDEEAGLSEVEH